MAIDRRNFLSFLRAVPIAAPLLVVGRVSQPFQPAPFPVAENMSGRDFFRLVEARFTFIESHLAKQGDS